MENRAVGTNATTVALKTVVTRSPTKAETSSFTLAVTTTHSSVVRASARKSFPRGMLNINIDRL